MDFQPWDQSSKKKSTSADRSAFTELLWRGSTYSGNFYLPTKLTRQISSNVVWPTLGLIKQEEINNSSLQVQMEVLLPSYCDVVQPVLEIFICLPNWSDRFQVSTSHGRIEQQNEVRALFSISDFGIDISNWNYHHSYKPEGTWMIN